MAIEIDQHFEEIDFGELPRTVLEWHENFLPPLLPLRGHLAHAARAHGDALVGEQPVQAPRGQPLLAPRPAR